MYKTEDLLPHGHYLKVLKPALPGHVFRPNPRKLLKASGYLLTLGGCYLLLAMDFTWWMRAALSIVIANLMACLAFIAHDLSHNTILRQGKLRYPLEVVLWGLNLIPATMWIRVHNRSHHAHANTPQDPDRRFLKTEETVTTRIYSRIFYPSRKAFRWNPVVGAHFVPYILRNVAGVFYPDKAKPEVVPYKVKFSTREQIRVTFELGVIAVIQVVIWHLSGATWMNYIWAGPIPVVLVSGIIMIYVFTNHYLNPVCESHDPVAGSTSVVVPRFWDRLHENFSYHTEHHLFPNMDSSHYPAVSEMLEEQFPERYNRMHIGRAWQKLWEEDEFE
ncbi:MAG: fatty acid desaturase [Bacteroidota bacterium]